MSAPGGCMEREKDASPPRAKGAPASAGPSVDAVQVFLRQELANLAHLKFRFLQLVEAVDEIGVSCLQVVDFLAVALKPATGLGGRAPVSLLQADQGLVDTPARLKLAPQEIESL